MDFIGFQTIYVPRFLISRVVIGLSLGWFKGSKGKMLQEGSETMIFQGHKTICSKCNHYVWEPATWTSIIHLLKSCQIYGSILFDLQFWLPMKFPWGADAWTKTHHWWPWPSVSAWLPYDRCRWAGFRLSDGYRTWLLWDLHNLGWQH